MVIMFVMCVCFSSYGQQTLSFSLLHDTSDNISVAIPFPRNILPLKSNIKIFENNKEIAAKIYTHLNWPSEYNDFHYIRALNISFQPLSAGATYRLEWSDATKPTRFAYPRYKLVDAKLPKVWLANSLYAPLNSVVDKASLRWFSDAYFSYGQFITNNNQVAEYTKKKAPFSQAAPWLYDRPYTLYQLYFKSGDIMWKWQAHLAALTYVENINEEGYFSLKKTPDLKYLIPSGVLLDYIFYPSSQAYPLLKRMYQNSLSWPVAYNTSKGFWTERNLSNAMGLALTMWELTNKEEYNNRFKALVEGSLSSIANIDNDGGCIQHYLKAHEGKNDTTMVCSPWMSALVVEQAWRYYLMTSDTQSARLIELLGTHAANVGTFKGHGPHMQGYTIPSYLTFFDSSPYNEPDQWTDRHHACDVAAMIAKAAYIRKIQNKPYTSHRVKIDELLKTCKSTVMKPSNTLVWSLSPLRKFNWWFNSTANLAWLSEQL